MGPNTSASESIVLPAAERVWRCVGTFSPALALLPGAKAVLGVEQLLCAPREGAAPELAAILSWVDEAGTCDANTTPARAFAEGTGLPHFFVGPGFVFRVGARGAAESALSLWIDERGPLGNGKSALEARLGDDRFRIDNGMRMRARTAITTLVRERISIWNCDRPLDPATRAGRAVLVVDAARRSDDRGDAYEEMWSAALREHPGTRVLVRAAHDPIRGRVPGYLDSYEGSVPRATWLDGPQSSFAVLDAVERVYVVDAHLGFEALCAGRGVTCFGAPWYAGFGLTDDRSLPPRGRPRSLEELFAAAYFQATRYAHPETRAACQLEDVLAHVARQRRYFADNRGTIFCHGFTLWKRTHVRAYLRSPENRVVFADRPLEAELRGFDANSKLLVWGTRERPDMVELAKRKGASIWRMEDGFIRSVGLGSDLTMPSSLVIDREGIYFDPSRPSELETILENETFSDEELARARGLARQIVESRVSKYNVGDQAKAIVRPAGIERVILVPGQVEDDASIRCGTRDVSTNVGLLEAVRAENPGAYIIFKPHPDVTDARRQGAVPEELALRLADRVITGVPLPAVVAIADEVHTMTSLVGFEALIRGLAVHAYGIPFYAGWGLTRDRHAVSRRTRRLSVDELIAGVLLRYPRYLSQRTRLFTTPEVIVAQLREQMVESSAESGSSRVWRELRRVSHVLRGLLDVP